jgi:hypothetical protein
MVGALILHGVDALAHAGQRRLLDWLGDAVAVKVISTVTAPSCRASIGERVSTRSTTG